MTESDLSPARFGVAFRGFMDAVLREAKPAGQLLGDRLRAHLNVDSTRLAVTAEEFDPFEHPNVQVALDEYLNGVGRRAELVGVSAPQKRYMDFGLSDLLEPGGMPGQIAWAEGQVDYINFHLAGDRVLSCVQFGVYLVTDGDIRLIVALTGPSEGPGPRPKVKVDTVSVRSDDGQALLAGIREAVQRLNVYRGHVISLSPGQLGMGPQTLVAFHTLPKVTRDDVVLPAAILERVERHTIVFAEHAAALLAAGRSLKRGLLLHGPPGTGKTLTLMYLIGQMPGRTVLLTTGFGMGLLQPVVQLARQLAPSMVVLEDVDLIAEERGNPYGGGPLLFELLNELDGLREDCDVIFALTTNRPELLEPALAARPGRVDLAVELPLPDAEGRRRLLELYTRGLDLHEVELDAIVAQIEGASPAYIKELVRKAALLAATEGEHLVLTAAHFETALAELAGGGHLARRLLGFQPSGAIASASLTNRAASTGLSVVE
ncbi:MAG: 26S protease regulatory subunit [Chloroflexia bacterium]|nr:26S protease regulatory subunit [Chloroflexia bacterium]